MCKHTTCHLILTLASFMQKQTLGRLNHPKKRSVTSSILLGCGCGRCSLFRILAAGGVIILQNTMLCEGSCEDPHQTVLIKLRALWIVCTQKDQKKKSRSVVKVKPIWNFLNIDMVYQSFQNATLQRAVLTIRLLVFTLDITFLSSWNMTVSRNALWTSYVSSILGAAPPAHKALSCSCQATGSTRIRKEWLSIHYMHCARIRVRVRAFLSVLV